MMRRALALVPWLLAAVPAVAADWTPRAWTDASTIELCTTRAGEGEHWFPVWLVVIDDQVYVRLGTRAATRIAFIVNLVLCLLMFLLGHLAPVVVQETQRVQGGGVGVGLVISR